MVEQVILPDLMFHEIQLRIYQQRQFYNHCYNVTTQAPTSGYRINDNSMNFDVSAVNGHTTPTVSDADICRHSVYNAI